MNEDIVKKAILTLEVLIDCCKEDGTSYTARKEWEALKVFEQLQNNWNELKKWLFEDGRYIDSYSSYELRRKIQELEQGKDE